MCLRVWMCACKKVRGREKEESETVEGISRLLPSLVVFLMTSDMDPLAKPSSVVCIRLVSETRDTDLIHINGERGSSGRK